MPKVKFVDTNASLSLDAIRGIAATLVLLEHWRNAFFVDFPQVQNHGWSVNALYLICSVGHQAVIIFFVLSGYLISGSILRAHKEGKWSWSSYATHRLVRLWVVLVPALLLGALWDNIGTRSHVAPILYAGANHNHMTPNVGGSLSLIDFIGNVGFLQTIIVPTFGSNGALWSLANEFWYYVIFPLLVCAAISLRRREIYVFVWMSLVLLVVGFMTREILALLPIWLMGSVLHFVKPKAISHKTRWLAAAIYTLCFLGSGAVERRNISGLRGINLSIMMGLLTCAFLWSLLGAVDRAQDSFLSRISRASARFSFSLYLLHTPILILFAALMVHNGRWQPTPQLELAAVTVLAIIVAYSWVVAAVTEFNTEWFRDLVENHLGLGFPKRRQGASAAQGPTPLAVYSNPGDMN